jgi:hypothetical protein
MSLNLKDEETVALISELAKRLGKTKTGLVRELARNRLDELDRMSAEDADSREADVTAWLEREIWPHTRHLSPLTKKQEEELLGYGEMMAR